MLAPSNAAMAAETDRTFASINPIKMPVIAVLDWMTAVSRQPARTAKDSCSFTAEKRGAVHFMAERGPANRSNPNRLKKTAPSPKRKKPAFRTASRGIRKKTVPSNMSGKTI
ncbi:hypothetical protein Cdeb_00647 [Caldibacillus debilis GB1]|uniref:Uncharacterized protein n=1 Tax=Caldibacillus debilis GB1 TaxID=1339248 RepID=A0A420VE03_9BACI|nr:hypothetical protein Cdeb_00647 [Caldibacillus debilis GB1]